MALVLVVEDNRAICHSLAEVLQEAGHIALEAINGGAMFRCLYQRQYNSEPLPDVLLLDLWMPVRGGWDLIEDLRSRDFQIPIVMISADGAWQENQARAKRAGITYLRKPIDIDVLLRAIQAAVEIEIEAEDPEEDEPTRPG